MTGLDQTSKRQGQDNESLLHLLGDWSLLGNELKRLEKLTTVKKRHGSHAQLWRCLVWALHRAGSAQAHHNRNQEMEGQPPNTWRKCWLLIPEQFRTEGIFLLFGNWRWRMLYISQDRLGYSAMTGISKSLIALKHMSIFITRSSRPPGVSRNLFSIQRWG